MIFAIVFSLIVTSSFCQPIENRQASRIPGNIIVPALQSIEVKTIEIGAIRFDDPVDFQQGKLLRGFYSVQVKSNVAWEVTAAIVTETVGDAQEPARIPPGFLSIKRSESREFISLSKTEKPLLQSENDNIVNTYSFDLLINPSWQVAGGIYNLAVIFTLTAQ